MLLSEDNGPSSGAIASAHMSQLVADLLLLPPLAPQAPDRGAGQRMALDEILADPRDRAETRAGPRNRVS